MAEEKVESMADEQLDEVSGGFTAMAAKAASGFCRYCGEVVEPGKEQEHAQVCAGPGSAVSCTKPTF